MALSTRGVHLVAEYWGCSAQALADLEGIERLTTRAVADSGAHIVEALFHRFAPEGVSGVILIAESHLSIHTWPAQGYAAVDFYTCGDVDPMVLDPLLRAALGATSGELLAIARGAEGVAMKVSGAPWREQPPSDAT